MLKTYSRPSKNSRSHSTVTASLGVLAWLMLTLLPAQLANAQGTIIFDSSSTARKALSLIINDLRRQQLVLALHFRSPWFWGHTFSLNVGGTATPTAINALWAWPST
jgi:hypothetical protein